METSSAASSSEPIRKSCEDKLVEDGVDDESSGSDKESVEGDIGDGSDEAYPSCLTEISWQLSKGPGGKLHLCGPDALHCGRILLRPEVGIGLAEAFQTERRWSPRCRAALPPAAKTWLDSCDKVEI